MRREPCIATWRGSRAVSGYKAYTASSRQEHEYHVVIDDAAERKEIVSHQPIGIPSPLPTAEDVLRNVAANLGRFETKRTASAVLGHTLARARDISAQFVRGTEASRQSERSNLQIRSYAIQRMTPAIERFVDAVERVVDKARSMLHERHEQRQRGQSLGM